MKNFGWLAAITLAVVITCAGSADASIVGGPQAKDTYDHGCTDVDSGSGDCFSYGADGANGGTAGGMSACTAYKNCVTCARPVGAIRSICVEARRNAECKCTDYPTGTISCASSGACTYKGQSDSL